MYVLHIGRHKTGTSSLQRFLASNRAALLDRGFDYPDFPAPDGNSIAHHRIAHIIVEGQKVGRSTDLDTVAERLPSLRSAIARTSSGEAELLLSSEAFQNCRPDLVGEVFEPESTRVVMYLREQVDYGISAWSQAVHARLEARPLERFLLDRAPDYEYDRFVRRWVDAFGRSRVTVRVYDRRRLRSGDVRRDFVAEALGLGEDAFRYDQADGNPSIGGPLLAVKLEMNRLLDSTDSEARDALYEPLATLAAERGDYRARPRIRRQLQTELRRVFEPSNARLLGEFPDLQFVPRDMAGQPWRPQYSGADLDVILARLHRASPEYFDKWVAPIASKLARGAA